MKSSATTPALTEMTFDDWYTSITVEGPMHHNMRRAWDAALQQRQAPAQADCFQKITNMLEGYASTYDIMARDKQGSGVVSTSCVATDIRQNMIAFVNRLAQQAEAAPMASAEPKGYALVPLYPNAEMIRVMAEDEWQWEDLLAAAEAITEDQYNEIATAPSPAATDKKEGQA